MQAKITINGNEGDGFYLRLEIPTAWLRKFDKDCCHLVMKEPLSQVWGDAVEDNAFRAHQSWRGTEDGIMELLRFTKVDIEDAKAKLRKSVNSTLQIDL